MSTDVWTIIWRDIRLFRAQYASSRRIVVGLLGSTIFLVLTSIFFDLHVHIAKRPSVSSSLDLVLVAAWFSRNAFH